MTIIRNHGNNNVATNEKQEILVKHIFFLQLNKQVFYSYGDIYMRISEHFCNEQWNFIIRQSILSFNDNLPTSISIYGMTGTKDCLNELYWPSEVHFSNWKSFESNLLMFFSLFYFPFFWLVAVFVLFCVKRDENPIIYFLIEVECDRK